MAITPVHDLNPQCTSTNPELVVIFFHGIGYGENADWKETWTSTTSDGKRVCWPQEWLPADLATQNVNNVRILSLSYDSALLGANEDVTDIGKNLVQSLVSKREYEPLWEAPIVLVGYSFGGLVVKSLIVEAEKRKNARIVNPLDARAKRSCTKFLENLKGTIFYGVPHTGGGGDFKQYFVYQSQRLNDGKGEQLAKSGILKNVEGFNREMAALSVDFENAVDQALVIYAFGEGQPLKKGESVLVPYASAQQLARRNHYKVEDATHITICQPTSRQAINYSLLKDVLAVVMEGTQMLSTPQSTPTPSQQSTHGLSQLRLLDTDSEIPSSLPTPQMKHIRMQDIGGSMCTTSEEYDKPVLLDWELRFSSEVPQEVPHIIEGTSEVPQGLPNIIEGTSEVPQELPNIIVGTSEVPQATPNIIEGVPSQDLELAANTLMNLQILILPQSENPVAINELQCQYLLEKFCDTLTRSCIQDASLQHIQKSHHTLKSLARLAKEAEKLVHDCCDAKWIQAAMIFGNAKEHFASLTFKLRLYMELLQSIFKEGATKEFLTKLQDPKWIDDVKDEEVHFIDEKAKEDRQRLLSRLTEVGSSDSENLIKRLEISSNRATFLKHNGSSVIEAWKVGYKSFQRVRKGQLGKGSSATMHKVTWLGKYFAEKCFHGPENQVFREEASLLAGLSHPNILPLFCYATGKNCCSLVMELMDEDLHSLMMRRLRNEETLDAPPFTLLEAVDIMLQVAEGMNYLHQNRVIHRDLKSMNILVKYNEHHRHVYAKVADFGLSKIKELSCTYSNLTMDLGTTRWMAPELFGDSEDHNVGPSSSSESLKYHFKVDVYSFGMVCYEILTGHVPFFVYTNLRDLRKRVKDGLRPDMPEQCPEQLSTLVQACYDRDPKARPSFPDICVELRHIMCSLMVDSTS